jgi:hypothetical protein
MPAPSHVEAFQLLTGGSQDPIRDYIAFGLFMQSEAAWVAQRPTPPTETQYRNYHQNILTPLERNRFRDGANSVLADFATKAIAAKSSEFLKHHRKFRIKGICEAFLGALFWTLFLIGGTILARRAGIDLLEIYKRAGGTP